MLCIYTAGRELGDLACEFGGLEEDGFVGGVGLAGVACANKHFDDGSFD